MHCSKKRWMLGLFGLAILVPLLGLLVSADEEMVMPEMTEDIMYIGTDGELAGYWTTPYECGILSRDTDIKLSGEASIKSVGKSDLQYGFLYNFEKPEELSCYNSLVFWIRSDVAFNPNIYTVELYSGGMYPHYTGYASRSISVNPPSTSINGWIGITISLDIYHVGYGYEYNFAMTQVTSFWLVSHSPGIEWLDCVYFAMEIYGDEITESTSMATGPWAGHWGIEEGTIEPSSQSYVGSDSVQVSVHESGDCDLSYYFDCPVDLTPYNGLRVFTYLYDYLHLHIVGVSFYSSSGFAYCPFNSFFHMYASYLYARWYLSNVPFDKSMYYDNGIDWTDVVALSFTLDFHIPITFCIDGLEFYSSFSNNPPIAEAGNDIIALIGEDITFNGALSYDPDGPIIANDWDFGDGSDHGNEAVVTHSFSSAGTYTVILSVYDCAGDSDTDTLTVTVITTGMAVGNLIQTVTDMNLDNGLDNSLDSKLENAKAALDNIKNNNRQDAVNKLEAFINEVEAQSGKSLTEEQANALIAYAEWIIENI